MHRTGKSVLETRPIYHKRDETIREVITTLCTVVFQGEVCGLPLSADPDALARAALGRGSRIVGVGLEFDDLDDPLERQVLRRARPPHALDRDIPYGAVAIRRKDFPPRRGGSVEAPL